MKKTQFKYMVHVRWSEEDGAYVAEVPELPGCATHGTTYEGAMRNVREAIATWIDGAHESGYPVPEPLAVKKFSGRFVARINPELHRTLVMMAKAVGKTLNGFVQELLESGVGTRPGEKAA